MSFSTRISSFIRNLARRQNVERELADEVRAYVELSIETNMKMGMSETDARRAALVELGGAEQVKENVREVRLGHFLETRARDVHFALRSLGKAPLFTSTVVLVPAPGIGSTALIFSIVNALLLRGPAFPEADRLYMLWQKIPQESRVSFSSKEFSAWQKQTEVFERLATFTGNGFTISGEGEPEMVIAHLVTPSFFEILHATPVRGRGFLEAESKAGNTHAVILSYGLWQKRFGGRDGIVGESITMNGEPYAVVGVMPESFDFPNGEAKIWVPANLDGPPFSDHSDAHFLRVLGKLKPGISRARLQAEIDVLGKRVNDPSDKTDRRFFAL